MQTSLLDHEGFESDLEDIDWSFKNAITDSHMHGLHKYPARMIPQIVDTLLSKWHSDGTIDDSALVYDPFAGSGTTLVEARVNGLSAVGTEINPFAALLARTKSTPVDVEAVNNVIDRIFSPDWFYRERFIDQSYQEAADTYSTKWGGDIHPDEDNYDWEYTKVRKGWYPEPQIQKIEAMNRFLTELRAEYDYRVIRFVRIALAQASREISYQDCSEFKRQRLSVPERETHNPPFRETFYEVLDENVKRLKEFNQLVDDTSTSTVELADCRDPTVFPEDHFDCIITSPPYGDSSTTVGYGQFSRDPAVSATPIKPDWMKNVDPSCLGGRNSESELDPETVLEWSDTFKAVISELKAKDGRWEDVLEFITDYAETIQQMKRTIKPGQPVAIVIGSRTVSRVTIPTPLITTEIALEVGLEHDHTFDRTIPSKTIPYLNAPENIPGVSGKTIADENVLVFSG